MVYAQPFLNWAFHGKEARGNSPHSTKEPSLFQEHNLLGAGFCRSHRRRQPACSTAYDHDVY
jgi:hypothetical protein